MKEAVYAVTSDNIMNMICCGRFLEAASAIQQDSKTNAIQRLAVPRMLAREGRRELAEELFEALFRTDPLFYVETLTEDMLALNPKRMVEMIDAALREVADIVPSVLDSTFTLWRQRLLFSQAEGLARLKRFEEADARAAMAYAQNHEGWDAARRYCIFLRNRGRFSDAFDVLNKLSKSKRHRQEFIIEASATLYLKDGLGAVRAFLDAQAIELAELMEVMGRFDRYAESGLRRCSMAEAVGEGGDILVLRAAPMLVVEDLLHSARGHDCIKRVDILVQTGCDVPCKGLVNDVIGMNPGRFTADGVWQEMGSVLAARKYHMVWIPLGNAPLDTYNAFQDFAGRIKGSTTWLYPLGNVFLKDDAKHVLSGRKSTLREAG